MIGNNLENDLIRRLETPKDTNVTVSNDSLLQTFMSVFNVMRLRTHLYAWSQFGEPNAMSDSPGLIRMATVFFKAAATFFSIPNCLVMEKSGDGDH